MDRASGDLDDGDDPGACPICGAPGFACRETMAARGGIFLLGPVEGQVTIKIERKLWRTADGRIVEDGDPAAAFLFATPGDEIPEDRARELGILKVQKMSSDEPKRGGRKQKDTAEDAAMTAAEVEEG